MGKIKQGILGSVSGKVGGVIGGSWKGIGYVRSIPASVADRKSTAQLIQRDRIKLLGKLSADLLAPIIKPLWDRFAIKMSGYNAFVKTNMVAIVSGTEVNLAAFRTSVGKMAEVPNVRGIWNPTLEVLAVQWNDNLPDAFSAEDDKIFIAVLDKSGNIYATVSSDITRTQIEALISLADMSFVPADARVFVSAMRKDGTIVSTSASAVPHI